MKVFLGQVSRFLLLIFLFNAGMFFFATQRYYSGYKQLPSRSFGAYLFADSHGLPLGKMPENYGVYNFASSGDSYVDIGRKLSYLLVKGYEVDTIYLSIDDHMLSPYREYYSNEDRSVLYTMPKDYSNYYSFIKNRYIKYYLPITQPKVALLLITFLKNSLKSDSNRSVERSWDTLSLAQKERKAAARVRVQFPEATASQRLQKELIHLVSYCQKKGVTIIGVRFPVTNSYIQAMDDRGYSAVAVCESLGVKILDYKSIFIGSEHLFKDQDHLNHEGGMRLTELLFN